MKLKVSKKTIAVSAIILLGLYLLFNYYKNVFENFEEATYNKINKGLNEVLACETDQKSCESADSNKIKDFPSFKRLSGWPKFNVMLFVDLMKARRTKGSDLSNNDIDKIIKEGKYDNSFNA